MAYFRWDSGSENTLRTLSKTKTIEQAALIIGTTYGSAKGRASRLKISFRKYGDSHHSAKIGSDDIELMRALYDEGVRINDICEKFDMTYSYVNQIVNYKFRFNG